MTNPTDSITLTREELEREIAKWLVNDMPVRLFRFVSHICPMSPPDIKTRAILEESLTTTLFANAKAQKEERARLGEAEMQRTGRCIFLGKAKAHDWYTNLDDTTSCLNCGVNHDSAFSFQADTHRGELRNEICNTCGLERGELPWMGVAHTSFGICVGALIKDRDAALERAEKAEGRLMDTADALRGVLEETPKLCHTPWIIPTERNHHEVCAFAYGRWVLDAMNLFPIIPEPTEEKVKL